MCLTLGVDVIFGVAWSVTWGKMLANWSTSNMTLTKNNVSRGPSRKPTNGRSSCFSESFAHINRGRHHATRLFIKVNLEHEEIGGGVEKQSQKLWTTSMYFFLY
jgi:hypothetical protein